MLIPLGPLILAGKIIIPPSPPSDPIAPEIVKGIGFRLHSQSIHPFTPNPTPIPEVTLVGLKEASETPRQKQGLIGTCIPAVFTTFPRF